MENRDKKLSFKETLCNIRYALKMGFTYTKSIFFNSLLECSAGYFQWVFFSSVFMKKIVDALDNNAGFNEILKYILICAAFMATINLYESVYQNAVLPLQMTGLYEKLYTLFFKKAQNVELKCYEDSEFYNRYTMAMDRADENIKDVIKRFWGVIAGAVATVCVFMLMFEIDHFAVLFIISPLVGNFVFGNWKNRFEYKRYQEQAPNNKVINYVSRAMYLPDYAKEIRLFKIFNLLRRQYDVATENNVKAADKYAFPNAHVNFWRITFTFSVIFEGMLLYAIYRFLVSGTISLAQLTIITSMMVSMTWILIGLFDDIVNLMKDGVFINNIRGFLEYKEEIPEDQDGIMPPAEFKELEFVKVCFSYKDEETVKDLSFKITEGENVALVGHNGAGKTTIIKLLLRLYDPTSGVILLNGTDIRKYNLHAYREVFSTTFQDFAIFGMTIKENVLMGRTYDDDDKVVEKALKKAGVYDKVMSLQNGINTMMTKEFDEEGAVLSGGESQKLAVARTFAKPSPVKIFDEPSSALDPIAEYELFKNIVKEGEGRTMLFISHRLSSVKNCDKVFLLEYGRLIEEGTHEELMKLEGKYAKMYKRQAMNYLAVEEGEVSAL